MADPTNTPTFAQVVRNHIESAVADMHVSMPATVLSFDSSRQSVEVQPVLREPDVDVAGDDVYQKLPVILDVPVAWMGAGGFRFQCDVKPGDTVILFFTQFDMSKWKVYGGEDVTPETPRRFSISDAFAVPGIRSFRDAFSAVPADTMAIGKDGGPEIQIDASEIRVGGSSPFALKSELNDLRTAVLNHTHSGVTSGGAITGIASVSVGYPTSDYPGTQVAKGS